MSNIVELSLFSNSLVTNCVNIRSLILHDSRECFSDKLWLPVKHKCNKRKDEKKMWKKALWTQMGVAEGKGKTVLIFDLSENLMEMSPPKEKGRLSYMLY